MIAYLNFRAIFNLIDFVIFMDFYIFIISWAYSIYYENYPWPQQSDTYYVDVLSLCPKWNGDTAGQTMAFTYNKRGCKLVYISLIKHVMLMTERWILGIISKFLSLLRIIIKYFIIMCFDSEYITCLVDIFTYGWINITENSTKCSFLFVYNFMF